MVRVKLRSVIIYYAVAPTMGDDDDEEEVESKFKGALDCMDELEQSLPINSQTCNVLHEGRPPKRVILSGEPPLISSSNFFVYINHLLYPSLILCTVKMTIVDGSMGSGGGGGDGNAGSPPAHVSSSSAGKKEMKAVVASEGGDQMSNGVEDVKGKGILRDDNEELRRGGEGKEKAVVSDNEAVIAEDSTDDDEEEEEEEVQSGALGTMTVLGEALPIKRGLSNFYGGRSKTFTNLLDVVTREDLTMEDLAKPESSLNKRRRILASSKRRPVSYDSLNIASVPASLHHERK